MARLVEQVFAVEQGELFRVSSFVDNDGVFFATIDEFDKGSGDWDLSTLTEFQQDGLDVVPILDDGQEILSWFGFGLGDLVSVGFASSFVKAGL